MRVIGCILIPNQFPKETIKAKFLLKRFFFPSKIQTYYLLYPSEFTYGLKELKDFSFGIQ